MIEQREEGHYWVIYGGEWQVASWSGHSWRLSNCLLGYKDSDLERILESKLPHPDDTIDQPAGLNPVVFFHHDPTQAIKMDDIAAAIAAPSKPVATDVMSRLIVWRKEGDSRSFRIRAASKGSGKPRAFKIALRSDGHMLRAIHDEQHDLGATLSDLLDRWEQAGY